MMCLASGMAHVDDQIVLVAQVPVQLATILMAKPQFLYSERMYDVLQDILTDEQKELLEAASVEARPLVFNCLAPGTRLA